MSDLVKRLRNGIIEHDKRWSGDTHADLGGSVDYDATENLMAEAAARITELEAEVARRWQPIETAPKDGSVIVAIGAVPARGGYSIIFWDTFHEEWAGYTAEDEKRLVKFPPLHWMPLPEPPNAA